MHQPERHLAAILAADVAGYSRLMSTNEEGTLARLKALDCDVSPCCPSVNSEHARTHDRSVHGYFDDLLRERSAPPR